MDVLKTKIFYQNSPNNIYLSENKNHYCYCLERYDESGIIKYAHGGDILGVSAYTQYYFDENLCIIIISNTESNIVLEMALQQSYIMVRRLFP